MLEIRLTGDVEVVCGGGCSNGGCSGVISNDLWLC